LAAAAATEQPAETDQPSALAPSSRQDQPQLVIPVPVPVPELSDAAPGQLPAEVSAVSPEAASAPVIGPDAQAGRTAAIALPEPTFGAGDAVVLPEAGISPYAQAEDAVLDQLLAGRAGGVGGAASAAVVLPGGQIEYSVAPMAPSLEPSAEPLAPVAPAVEAPSWQAEYQGAPGSQVAPMVEQPSAGPMGVGAEVELPAQPVAYQAPSASQSYLAGGDQYTVPPVDLAMPMAVPPPSGVGAAGVGAGFVPEFEAPSYLPAEQVAEPVAPPMATISPESLLQPPEAMLDMEPAIDPAMAAAAAGMPGMLGESDLMGFPEAAEFSAATAAAAADAEAAAVAGDPSSWWTGTQNVTAGGQLSPFEPFVAPVPEAAAAYASEATADDEDMEWEGPPEIGPDGRGPWLDGPDAPWREAPSKAGRRAAIAVAISLGAGLAIAAIRMLFT
jgi:hypothetical protein